MEDLLLHVTENSKSEEAGLGSVLLAQGVKTMKISAVSL